MKIYRVQCYVNAWRKRTKEWESKYSYERLYVGKEGLKSAIRQFEIQKEKFQYERAVGNWNKYGEVRGKCELHEPHILEDGSLAYWGDKIIMTENPDNI